MRLQVLGLVLQRFGVGLGRAAEVAGLQRLAALSSISRSSRPPPPAPPGRPAGRRRPSPGSRAGPMKPSTGWPFDEGVDRRDRLHAQLAGEARILVDVDLDQLHRALGGADRLFERWGRAGWHGPHQGAQKSTITGWLRRASITSAMKLASVPSLIIAVLGGFRRLPDIKSLPSQSSPPEDGLAERPPQLHRCGQAWLSSIVRPAPRNPRSAARRPRGARKARKSVRLRAVVASLARGWKLTGSEPGPGPRRARSAPVAAGR